MQNRHGMTLIEMLLAMVIFSIILGGSLSMLSFQSRALDRHATDMGLLQNLSFGGDLLGQEFRLSGSNVPFQQPMILYAGPSTFIFNADYASNTDSLFAVFYNPGMPTSQVSALLPAQRFALPGTSPAMLYPDSTYYAAGSSVVTSPAETILWLFQLDTSTTATNDYLLLRQVNDQAPEVVIRNVIQTPGRNFFRYYYKRIPASGSTSASLDTVPSSWMPVRHTWAMHGAAADTGASARADSLGAVEVSFTVTNGLTGTALRSRAINFMASLPNIGTKKVTTCGGAPILGTVPVALWTVDSAVAPWDSTIILTWARALDESGGEADVQSYVIWRRDQGTLTWPEPIATVAAGSLTPSWEDETAVPGAPGYQYMLAAQDCTPLLSTTAMVTAPLLP
jgi:prepilin-type N-terminal cleavage/methylation domain-containing protein